MIRTRRLRSAGASDLVEDPSILAGYLEDESGAEPGEAAGLVRPTDEASVAAFLRSLPKGRRVLCQAARSSLTGGAIPRGEVVVSVERMTEISAVESRSGGARVTVGPGVRLSALQEELARRGWYFPPVPTFQEAMVGGTVSTNAGGAASFKYGVTRDWVHGLRVLLHDGDLLEIERGEAVARPGETFRIGLAAGGELAVPVPDYRLPEVRKISAGYFAADPLDLVDLFVGSEGTLGLITSVTLELVPLPASLLTGVAFVSSRAAAIALAAALRNAALAARASADPLGPDVRAIELLDDNCLRLIRERGAAGRLRVRIPDDAVAALLFETELPERLGDEQATALLAGLLEGEAPFADGPLPRLLDALRAHDALEGLELALPRDEARRRALTGLREAAPTLVNELLARRRRRERSVKKIAGDLVVPFERLPEMMELYERAFRSRGLEFAVWGHLSDGNLHPNALPRDAGEVRLAVEALLELADEATRRGGCPLSEHGVGRDPVKQRILRRFLGDEAIATMRRIRRALDPVGRFAPGVLFPPG